MPTINPQSFSSPQVALKLLSGLAGGQRVQSGSDTGSAKSPAQSIGGVNPPGDSFSMSPERAPDFYGHDPALSEMIEKFDADEVLIHLRDWRSVNKDDFRLEVQKLMLKTNPGDADLQKAIKDGSFVLKFGDDIPAGLHMSPPATFSVLVKGSIQGGGASLRVDMDFFDQLDPGSGKECGQVSGVSYYCSWPRA